MADRNQPHTPQDDSAREAPAPAHPSSKPQPQAEIAGGPDQDFDQRPGFGGYGADGGGYGSQTSYGSHTQHRSQADISKPDSNSPRVTRRTGSGATSSHTGTGTQTPDTATGASHGSTFGGATTESEALSTDDASNADTFSSESGSVDGLAGRSVHATVIPERD